MNVNITEEFAGAFRSGVVDRNIRIYSDIVATRTAADVKDEYWRSVLELFSSLSPEQRVVLLDIMKQVAVDAVASVFGVLDGISTIDGLGGEIAVTYDGATVSGDLQEYFLAVEAPSR